jgi:sec-independent protein translocase protein TatA
MDMIGNLGLPELLIILVIVLVLFGAKRLPEIARSIGQSVHALKKGIHSVDREIKDTQKS